MQYRVGPLIVRLRPVTILCMLPPGTGGVSPEQSSQGTAPFPSHAPLAAPLSGLVYTSRPPDALRIVDTLPAIVPGGSFAYIPRESRLLPSLIP